MLELVSKVLKIALLAIFWVFLIASASMAVWLWPVREKIQNRPLRYGYIVLVYPIVLVAATVGHFEKLYEGVGKF